jgi:hypothetical protein
VHTPLMAVATLYLIMTGLLLISQKIEKTDVGKADNSDIRIDQSQFFLHFVQFVRIICGENEFHVRFFL